MDGILSLLKSRKSFLTIALTVVAWFISKDPQATALVLAILGAGQSHGIAVEDAGKNKGK